MTLTVVASSKHTHTRAVSARFLREKKMTNQLSQASKSPGLAQRFTAATFCSLSMHVCVCFLPVFECVRLLKRAPRCKNHKHTRSVWKFALHFALRKCSVCPIVASHMTSWTARIQVDGLVLALNETRTRI